MGCKLKTQVLNAMTKGEVLSDHLIPKENVLWELHEAESWWDRKLDQMPPPYEDGYDEAHHGGMASTDQMMGYAGTHTISGIQDDDDEDFGDDAVRNCSSERGAVSTHYFIFLFFLPLFLIPN